MLELCAGTLEEFVNGKYKGPMPTDAQILYQIACGLNYIHLMKLVHRDIKPENILISITDPVRMKIADFGLSKDTNTRGTFTVSGIKGTLNWIAPECFPSQDSEEDVEKRGSVKSDIFSAGCVFFYFATRGIHLFGEGFDIMANILKKDPVNLTSE